jgi:hypothetical protein
LTRADLIALLRRILAESGPAVCLPMKRKDVEALLAALQQGE